MRPSSSSPATTFCPRRCSSSQGWTGSSTRSPRSGERRVERGAVDGRVVAQQPLGELGAPARRRRCRTARARDRRPASAARSAPAPRARRRSSASGSSSQRLLAAGCAMWPSSPACSLSTKLSGAALHSASISSARASRNAPSVGDVLADAREQERRVGAARAGGGDVVVVDRLGRAELVGEHAHERVDRDRPRLAAGHRDVRGRAEAVAVRRREVTDAGEHRRALVGERQHRDELVALLRELGHAGGGHGAPLAAFARVAVQQRLGGRADGRLVAARLGHVLARAGGSGSVGLRGS